MRRLRESGRWILCAGAIGAVAAASAQAQAQEEAAERGPEVAQVEPGEEPVAGPGEEAAIARAPQPASAYTAETWPTQYVLRPLTLAGGMLSATLNAELAFEEDAIFEPFSLAPDIYFGFTDRFTGGIIHSARALSLLGAGNGICLIEDEEIEEVEDELVWRGGCGDRYNNLGLDALYALDVARNIDVAAHGTFLFQTFDPFATMLKLGALGRWTNGAIGVRTDPWIGIALTERDENSDILNLPVEVTFQATENLALQGGTGLNTELDDFEELLLIPVSVGAVYALTNQLDLEATFGFPGVTGSDIADTGSRVLNVAVTYRAGLI